MRLARAFAFAALAAASALALPAAARGTRCAASDALVGSNESVASNEAAVSDALAASRPSAASNASADSIASAASGASGAAAQSGAADAGAPADLDEGARLWRAGDLTAAAEAWRSALDALGPDGPPAERARLAYNLGNAAYRRGAPLEAAAWFTASLSLRPRDDDATANLALARAEAGLQPLDAGDLLGTTARAIGSFTEAEAGWIALAGIALLAAAAAFEALRGGLLGRVSAALAALACAASFAPLVYVHTRPAGPRYMVVAPEGVDLRSEPRADAKRLGSLEPGAVARGTDRYFGWARVRTPDGELWADATGLFDLTLAGPGDAPAD